jgi:hypothetical protein
MRRFVRTALLAAVALMARGGATETPAPPPPARAGGFLGSGNFVDPAGARP